ncbi:MAG: CvpA family protein [Clostridiaceae bacterium]|nr:CvpA family protein [Clostridiaceae bacterium]
MSIIIDLIIIAIVGICVFFGYKKGLTKSVIKILSFIIAIAVAAILFKPVSNIIIDNTQIDETIKQSVVNIVKEDVKENGEVKEDTDLPKTMVEYINKSVETAVQDTKETIVENAANGIAVTSINVGVAILLFIIVRVLLIFVSALSKIITDLPIIKQFDKTGGLLYGLVKSLVIILVIFALISFISPLIGETGIITEINKSFIGSILYNNNLLLKIIF